MQTKAAVDKTKNPWLRPAPSYYPVKEIQAMSVEDRLYKLTCFDSAKLRAVIAWPGTQKTVRARAERFLKRREIDVNKSGG